MIANDYENYGQNDSNLESDNRNYGGENNLEQDLSLSEDQNSYLDSEFSNALERDDENELDQNYDDSELEEDDLQEEEDFDEEEDLDADDLDDDLVEDYDENDREPETFADDGYKID